jgi:hypothetical protein
MVDVVNWVVLAGTRMCARCPGTIGVVFEPGIQHDHDISRAHGFVARAVERAITWAPSTYRMWLQATVEACDTRKKLLQESRPLVL